MHAKSLQLCLTLWDHLDCSPPGSSIHGALQARVLEWVTLPFSRGSSQPRDRTHISYVSCTDRQVLYHWRHLRSPCGSKGLPFPALKISKLLLLRICSSARISSKSPVSPVCVCFALWYLLIKTLNSPIRPPPFFLRRYYCLLAGI